MPYWNNPHSEPAHAYQPKQWFTALEDVVLATTYFNRGGSVKNVEFPPLGALREENEWLGAGVYKNIKVDGHAVFQWVWNNSGSNIARGVPMVKRASQAITNITSGGKYSATLAGTFTANKEIGGLLHVTDDAGAAGAAPEGESAKIYENDADTLYFQPDLSAVLAVNDDLLISYKDHVLAAGAGAQLCDFRGVPVASGGIPDGYMGWACVEADAVAGLVGASTATITTEKGLIAGTAIFADGSSSAVPLILAFALQAVKSDTVSRLAMMSLARLRNRGASA